MAAPAPGHTYYLSPYPAVRLIILIIAILIELLAAFNVSLGPVGLVPLGLAVFFISLL